MQTPVFHRLRAGFYITHDAQFRIVRRSFMRNNIRIWYVELWNPNERQYNRVGSASTLSAARQGVKRMWSDIVRD